MRLLHLGLRAAGIDSRVLCWDEPDKIPHVTRFNPPQTQRKLGSILRRLTAQLGLNDVNHVSTWGIRRYKEFLHADILNFHILNGWFSYLALPSLTKNKHAVWSLHDMWGFTGHCYYSLDCERWKIGCGRCPYPNIFPSIRRDNTHIEWKLKNWVYHHSNLHIVTTSTWLTNLAKQSMFNSLPIHQIPYGIDTDIYRRLDPERCRLLLGISPQKKVLVFTSDYLNNHMKGVDVLVKALQRLPRSLKAECVLLLLGHHGEELANAVDIPVSYLGYVKSDHLKAIAYSAGDLFLFPSRAETFGLVALESMACGTPVVAFSIGGVLDHIRPGITGYLAIPENAEDFSNGIVQLLEDDSLWRCMSTQCRLVVSQEYNKDLYVQRYIELYENLLVT
jgi:glycosyltransferase involved in cell wall biosynthesis